MDVPSETVWEAIDSTLGPRFADSRLSWQELGVADGATVCVEFAADPDKDPFKLMLDDLVAACDVDRATLVAPERLHQDVCEEVKNWDLSNTVSHPFRSVLYSVLPDDHTP
jgi:hypothetical protein